MTSLSKGNSIKHNLLASSLASIIVSIASFYAPIASAAPIYKIVDAQTGQVTFTDSPQSYEQQAGKQISQIAITTGNSTAKSDSNNNRVNNSTNNVNANSNATSTLSTQAVTALPELPVKAVQIRYQLSMIEPSETRAYQRPAQTIIVKLQLSPALQPNDYVVIYLDGKEVAQGLSVSIPTVDLLPGEHSIQALVKNESGQTLQQVERTVFVIQNTAILQKKKQIAKQLAAYQRLPLQQKIMLKIRQQGKPKS